MVLDEHPEKPTALQLFLVFSRIGLTSFGGGLSGLFMREFVDRRAWISRDEFMNGLALSQALPGVNVKNLSIWIGYRIRGRSGAIAGFLGTILPPAIFIIVLASLFARLTQFDLTQSLLIGAGAAAVGLSLSMGLIAGWHVPREAVPMILMATTFVAIGIFHLSLILTVLVAGGIGFAHAYYRAGS
ncbi:chromate transporter [Faunimonas pinastri]|uniref:Chromate transporter n=1 Tax=Faunimonas pinastri TaxID=1855383 RepID=A0A1H9K2Z4_9HYPH|nr:chromate transporter [Faunimonas pinastri]SEQ93621.1 chromate transporter [Faunimonas pinastri]